MFIDVTMPDQHVKDWKEASKAIIDCAQRAEKLLARSACCAHALVYHQVLALVEHYFLCVLPVPVASQVKAQMTAKEADDDDDDDGAGGAAGVNAKDGGATADGADGGGGGGGGGGGDEADALREGPYTPREHIDINTQRDCLRALNDTMLLYVAASKTVWQSDDSESEVVRVITVGAIFAVFDAVLRLQVGHLPISTPYHSSSSPFSPLPPSLLFPFSPLPFLSSSPPLLFHGLL